MTIHAALVAALAELTNPTKDRTANAGPYSYKYADLATVIDHVRPVLAAHDLAVTQNVVVEENRLEVWTYLHHSSGELLTYGPITGRAGGDWQTLGGAITYLRRYSLGAALGIAPEDDDDAASSSSRPRVMDRAEPTPERIRPTSPPADQWQTPAPVDPETGEQATLEAAISTIASSLGGQEFGPLDGLTGPARRSVDSSGSATPKQIGFAKQLIKQRFPDEATNDETARAIASGILLELGMGPLDSWDDLAKRPATKLIDCLKSGGAA